MIQQNILDSFPTWYKELDANKHYLVLSNDFDSYYSCKYLTERFNLEIGGFFDFKSGLWLNAERTKDKQPIYVDLSISEGMTFDNHYTIIKNANSINPNSNISTYNRKYNGSTLALVCALYDRDFSELSETTLTAILCIDSWHYGYYNKGGKYRDINLYWYKALGMSEYLLPILEKHDMQYFVDFISKYRLKEPINIDDGFLFCAAKINIPKCKFELQEESKRMFVSKEQAQSMYKKNPTAIVASTETYSDHYAINIKGE